MPITYRCYRIFIVFPCYYELYEHADLLTPSGLLGKLLFISYILNEKCTFQCCIVSVLFFFCLQMDYLPNFASGVLFPTSAEFPIAATPLPKHVARCLHFNKHL